MTTHSDTPHGGEDAALGEALQADDPDAYSDRRRLRAIHDARERVLEKRRDADRVQAEKRLNPEGANTLLRRAVEDYLMEVEGLLAPNTVTTAPQEDDTDSEEGAEGDDYWSELYIDTQYVGDKPIHFTGLKSVLEAPDPLIGYTTTQVADHYGGTTEEHEPITSQISRHILLQAYRRTNEALAKFGLDVELKEGTQEAYFDYSDLLKPGEEDPRPDNTAVADGGNTEDEA